MKKQKYKSLRSYYFLACGLIDALTSPTALLLSETNANGHLASKQAKLEARIKINLIKEFKHQLICQVSLITMDDSFCNCF